MSGPTPVSDALHVRQCKLADCQRCAQIKQARDAALFEMLYLAEATDFGEKH